MNSQPSLHRVVVGIKGAGEMATGVACRLYSSGFRKIYMTETANPLAVRRGVSFCEAVHEGRKTVEEVEAMRIGGIEELETAWMGGKVAVCVDPSWELGKKLKPHVLIDAVLAKKNIGTHVQDAPLVIGLGPGFSAGSDTHMVIETQRGHDLGRILTSGAAASNTGIPGSIGGYSLERVYRAPESGVFETHRHIGDTVNAGDVLGNVNYLEIRAGIDGVIRGIIRSGTVVPNGLKLGDIDPRGKLEYCFSISEKARAIAGSVLEAILRVYNV